MQAYSDPKRESDPYSLPDVEVFQLTATECAAMDEDLIWEYGKRREFQLYTMNSRVRDAMLDAIVEEQGIEGGWFWWTCLPGCLPDSSPFGPFKTRQDALADAQENADIDDEDSATPSASQTDDRDANAATHNIDIAYARACHGTCADCGATPDECFDRPCTASQTE